MAQLLLEDSMATAVNTSPGAALSPDYMQRVEELAQKHGWTVDETIDRALDLTEIVLNAKDHDPDSKVYLYRDGKRYAVEIAD